MRPFTFLSMLMQQRIDDALRLERTKSAHDPRRLALLRRRRAQLGRRLSRALLTPAPVGS